jgi:signal transduction histidine kinase
MADDRIGFLSRIRAWLLGPPARITQPEKIQRSQLLSTILLVLIVLSVMILSIVLRKDPRDIQAPEVKGGFLVLGIVIGMYVLNRFGYNRFAAAGVIIPFVIVFTYVAFFSRGKAPFLAFLLVPILLTAIFFPLRWTAIISGSILLVILILLTFQDQSTPLSPFWPLRSMWFMLVLVTGLLLTFMWHLANLERIRQQELRRMNEELEQRVAELERFTYTVSHELKAPIVTIKGFLGSIERDLEATRYEQAGKDLARISTAADSMHATLSDLLSLSRAGRLVNPFTEFSLSDVVQEAIALTRGTIESHHIRLQVHPALPMVYGDFTRMREVFENLIDNAAKYMGNQTNPVIEIGTRNDHGATTIFVKDNGIGIEPQYQKRIFGLFEKLNPASEGTGIGLALIKRIVEVNGGKIWVESEGLGKGSTFCFTVPDGKDRKTGGG